MNFGFEFVIIAVMLTLNAVFAGYEMALASVSRARLIVLVSQKKKGAEAAAFMKDRMEASLAVVQLGITLVGAIAAATGGAGVGETLEPYLINVFGISQTFAEIVALTCLVIPLSAFTIVFAELIPKMFALNNREWVCLKLSPMMKLFSLIAYPIVSVFETIVKKVVLFGSQKMKSQIGGGEYTSLHELKAAASLARAALLIGATQEKIVLAATELSHRPISSVMLPASEISMIYLMASLNDALIKAHLDMHTRFPVCEKENDPETIKGYVNFKDIVNAIKFNPENPTIEGIRRPLKSLRTNISLSDSLAQMITEKNHIALVRDEREKVVGLVTLEDIMEELVGEIEDEFDRLPAHIHPFGSGWIMGGGVPMNLVLSTIHLSMPIDWPAGRTPILAEWLILKLGRGLEAGEIIQIDSLQVTVRKLRRKKLYEGIINVVK